MKINIKNNLISILLIMGLFVSQEAIAETKIQTKPNILIIFPDDVGYSNINAYSHGIHGYKTPNMDRIIHEGTAFTDQIAQPSCTAGRAALITGQMPIRTGLTTVGFPGDKLGIQKEDPTLAEVLKKQGYRTGQFGKNHLGDRNEHLPTVHGFDEFYGNLYHLNTSEEFESPDYPTHNGYPNFGKEHGNRGILHSWATDVDDETVDPRFGKVGKQKIKNLGLLGKERMKTIDVNFTNEAIRFMKEAKEANEPFFVWYNPTRMHVFTHVEDKYIEAVKKYTTAQDLYGAGMIQLDELIGSLLNALDEMGLTENTIVVLSSDNGAELNMWPDGGNTPFHGEKMTTYEGGVRVPFAVRWPNKIPANRWVNEIQSHEDIFTTLASAAGVENIHDKLMKEKNVYIDGVDNLDLWTGKTEKSKRDSYIYYYESSPKAIRLKNWKVHFATKENYWGPYTQQSFPIVYNLRKDPYERYSNYRTYGKQAMHMNWLFGIVKEKMKEHVMSLQKYPPRQKANSMDVSKEVDRLLNMRPANN